MIYVLYIDSPGGGGRLRIVSDEPDSFSCRHVWLSFKAYVTRNLRSFDAATETWEVAPEAREDFGRWVVYAAMVCGAYFSVRDLDRTPSAGPVGVEEAGVADEWPEYIGAD